MHCRYRNEWKEDEARKNIMRTHTTAISSRMLSRVAEELKQVTVCTAWRSLEAGPSIQGRFVAPVCCRLEHFGLGNFSVWTESSATKPWMQHTSPSSIKQAKNHASRWRHLAEGVAHLELDRKQGKARQGKARQGKAR